MIFCVHVEKLYLQLQLLLERLIDIVQVQCAMLSSLCANWFFSHWCDSTHFDPYKPENYRPSERSSIHSKFVILPTTSTDISDCQFGFQAGRSNAFAYTLINDVTTYFVCNQVK